MKSPLMNWLSAPTNFQELSSNVLKPQGIRFVFANPPAG
jgi:hypothetical protein